MKESEQSLRRLFKVERNEIAYLRFTLESYDGMAVVSTLDPQKALIEILIAPGCEAMVMNLLDSLRREERGLKIDATWHDD
jgi:hypothetical protein